MMNIQCYFRLSALGKKAQKEEQRELRRALCLWGMRHASRARMKKRLKYDPTGGANVCVVCVWCVCVWCVCGVCVVCVVWCGVC